MGEVLEITATTAILVSASAAVVVVTMVIAMASVMRQERDKETNLDGRRRRRLRHPEESVDRLARLAEEFVNSSEGRESCLRIIYEDGARGRTVEMEFRSLDKHTRPARLASVKEDQVTRDFPQLAQSPITVAKQSRGIPILARWNDILAFVVKPRTLCDITGSWEFYSALLARRIGYPFRLSCDEERRERCPHCQTSPGRPPADQSRYRLPLTKRSCRT